ncbi:MAG TPA: ATP-binding protein, partial [Chitinophagaceae bacterium]|nr:ATP-binding protein [Chitinophagaceae bacterium]
MEIIGPNPFTVFAGPNASGKSNIFEALQLLNHIFLYGLKIFSAFGSKGELLTFQTSKYQLSYEITFEDGIKIPYTFYFSSDESETDSPIAGSIVANPLSLSDFANVEKRNVFIHDWIARDKKYENDFEQFIDNFSRIFVGNSKIQRVPSVDKLSGDAENLKEIIPRIFEKKDRLEDFNDWLRILVPEFESIEIKKSNIDGSNDFFIHEKSSGKPFSRKLISDGTYNILSLMAAVYQSGKPQFLCIEEPENGLNPYVIKTLVEFFRKQCGEKGHYIWLNTHSQTLVKHLQPKELILVDKINGETKIKQFPGNYDLHGLELDEAWLSNAL